MALSIREHESDKGDSETGRSFQSFPFEPYDIQLNFMRSLYQALDQKSIGLFESPTGTGKTLSLICGALEWLEVNKQRQSALDDVEPEGDEPPWVLEQFRRMSCRQHEQQEDARTRRIEKTRQRIKRKRQRKQHDGCDAEFLLSDTEDVDSWSSDASEDEEAQEAPSGVQRTQRQIIFCSRTHSQLSQFIGEFKRTRFAERLSLVTLASRKALCLNETVSRLKSATIINEKCLELKNKKSTKKTRPSLIQDLESKAPSKLKTVQGGSCPFLMKREAADKKRHSEMINTILSEPMDIESLGDLGRSKTVCPYYSTRAAVQDADIILLPYSSLLSEQTKESLGIETEGNVLIIDEAHNLMDAINNTHKAMIDEALLNQALKAIEDYFHKFELRLSPTNLENIRILIQICISLLEFCSSVPADQSMPHVQSVNQFLFATGIDNINFLKIVKWMKDTRLPYKVSNYKAMDVDGLTERTSLGCIYMLSSFLNVLHNEDSNGCLIIDRNGRKESNAFQIQLSFVLLNPAAHFEKILDSCHSVILASGTLSPLTLIQSQLFSKTEHLDRLKKFSCSHIVPKERVMALTLTHGPSTKKLDLRFENRSRQDQLKEVAMMLLNFCNVIPEGFIVFVPSFLYLSTLMDHLRTSGALENIAKKKKIFSEPRSAAESEETFKRYKTACISTDMSQRGALLLCVVGGKMSEGINFGDELGRCVLMLGLPYPNSHDPELQERMKHINKTKDTAFHLDSHQYYEDLCIKAVNQSIGRVIRHIKDYACIVLADVRYSNPSIQQKLPHWIRPSLAGPCQFKDAFFKIVQFFRTIKNLQP